MSKLMEKSTANNKFTALHAMWWLIVMTVSGNSAELLEWSELPALPNKLGVAGPFAGTHQGALIVAGGANFPDKLPWEGGTKVWYDTVYLLERPDAAWQVAGKLPRPLGYGVTLSIPAGMVCIGGSDAVRHYADVWMLRWEDGELKTSPLPSLPRACANFCGASLGDTLYVAGGIETPNATSPLKTFWSLDLKASLPEWKELDPWPGPPRMLAVAATDRNVFYLAGGTDLFADELGKPARKYLKDGYGYRPSQGWIQLADMPRPAVAAPTPAPSHWNTPSLGPARFFVLSGDDGSLVNFQPPDAHPGFPKSILAYNATTDQWDVIGQVPAGHVTTTIVEWNGGFVMPSGEIRPGVRSPAVWFGQFKHPHE